MSVSPFIIDIILEAVDAVKMLQSDIRETGEDSHIETHVIVNKLALTMDSADELMLSVSSPPKVVMDSGSYPPSQPPAEMTPSSVVVPPGASALSALLQPLNEPIGIEGVGESSVVAEGSVGLSDVLNKMQETLTRTVQVPSGPAAKPSGGKDEDHTVRVETKRLDHVMNLVGELVLNRNRLIKLGNGLEEQDETNPALRELNVTLAQLNLVTSDLQLAVMKTRMVPIRKVFS
ncbi:MAG: chemotaxis protein CheA, partial [Nitrospirae bacterium CG_4_9_14_3_um_filter_51_5]